MIAHALGSTWYARLPQSHLVPTQRLHETSNERNTLSYFVYRQRGKAGGYINAFHVVTEVRFDTGKDLVFAQREEREFAESTVLTETQSKQLFGGFVH